MKENKSVNRNIIAKRITPLSSFNSAELEKIVIEKLNEPKFRAKQLAEWLYKKLILDANSMKNIPAKLFDKLTENDFTTCSSEIIKKQQSHDGTTKILIQLADNEVIESVIIPSDKRITFCLSTQVGCPVQCYFCASGKNGLTRNLSAGEIVEQFIHCCSIIGHKLPSNIVFMGIGEGLLNLENLLNALEIISSENEINLGARRITVSTSGWVPGIVKLADQEKQFNLALSLHAVDDEMRSKLIPGKMRYPVNKILEACRYYRQKTNRMVTYEYTLLKGINDSIVAAKKLTTLALENRAKVNLIPYNSTENNGFYRPSAKRINEFSSILEKAGVQVSVRREMGNDVDAACGQLRNKYNK
ncbi:23S rRNA (adenine(2503)-C(2))-methyltransferase RlmN [Lentisphaerota bacterium WC36G]|nr:23S rRNA (adenine(2503)-C(2))-methyltransferase RlmN [Lentisphaerae bacterium WC36]